MRNGLGCRPRSGMAAVRELFRKPVTVSRETVRCRCTGCGGLRWLYWSEYAAAPSSHHPSSRRQRARQWTAWQLTPSIRIPARSTAPLVRRGWRRTLQATCGGSIATRCRFTACTARSNRTCRGIGRYGATTRQPVCGCFWTTEALRHSCRSASSRDAVASMSQSAWTCSKLSRNPWVSMVCPA